MAEPDWELYVEGRDDKMAVGHLLKQLEYDGCVWDRITIAKGKENVLKTIKVSVPAGTGKSLGFILDANGDLDGTWQSIASRLKSVGVGVPSAIPEDGLIGFSEEFGTRVGVWVMPDNQRGGALEDFLMDLVCEGDELLRHAEKSTMEAKDLGAQFADKDAKRAILHTWLAWQKNPGKPFGTAIHAGFLQVDGESAKKLVAWVNRIANVEARSSNT